jgi:aminoglycoside 6'-N-acetyltransferase
VLLSTERLIIRRFRPDDADAFARYRSDPEVARYQSWIAPFPAAEARRLVTGFGVAVEDAPGWFQYAIEPRAEGGLAGDVALCRHTNGMQAELGYTLAAAHQGKGYATEAVRAVLDRAFGTGLRRVSAECDARNAASARLLERLGFRREGHRVEHTWIKGEWTDDLLFGLLARDWRG